LYDFIRDHPGPPMEQNPFPEFVIEWWIGMNQSSYCGNDYIIARWQNWWLIKNNFRMSIYVITIVGHTSAQCFGCYLWCATMKSSAT
jgi:hypothetical protein